MSRANKYYFALYHFYYYYKEENSIILNAYYSKNKMYKLQLGAANAK